MILLLFSCLIHTTTLKGIVDYAANNTCAIVLDNNETIIIESEICRHTKEGELVYFYARKK
tara:strand:+ start:362 stop:544 length:183 start_codon:yes stop_codon:yes gene_type:complete